jgi:hypothetical protein
MWIGNRYDANVGNLELGGDLSKTVFKAFVIHCKDDSSLFETVVD